MDDPSYKVAISNIPLTKKILPGDPIWKQFNSSFDNMELSAEMVMDKVWKGHSLTTWHRNNWRTSENFQCGQHIGLDFDAGDKTSSLEHLSRDKFISKYGAFLYTTPSHTAEAPRARAIFVLDTPIMQAKNYTLAVSAILWLFGTADRQCKDAVRFFYGSKDCEVDWINQILPLDVVKKLIVNYRETGLQERHAAAKSDYHAPPSQQEVADALKVIPPWGIEYDEWVSILMAIHAEFGEGGFHMATSWADGKNGEVDQKWRSFKTSKTSLITIATLFAIAKRFGWKKLHNA